MTWVLVTGGSGFIGQHLVAALLGRGRQTRILDLCPPSTTLAKAQYVEGSVLDFESVDQALDDVDEVYHLAGLPGMWTPHRTDFHAVNCRGTQVIIAAAHKRGISRLLYCSTESILFRGSRSTVSATQETLPSVEDMPGPYTRSKLLAEQIILQAAACGFPVVIGSPTMPIGPYDHNLTPPAAMVRHFLRKRICLYLDFVVNLVDVRDVAAGLILAMEHGQVGHRYVLGGESIPLKKLLQHVAAINRYPRLCIPVPGPVAELATAIMEFVADHFTYRPPAGTAEGVRIAKRSATLSIDKARHELGYTPRPVEPALRETIADLVKANA